MAQAELEKRFHVLSGEELRRYVADGQEENLHLDFKNLSDGNLRSGDDKRNFAKALSGFANSDGGIVVWGVDARKDDAGVDCAQQLSPIANVGALLPRLNSLTGDLVSPSVDGVEHRVLLTQPDGCGCAATIIPRSDIGPHMAKAGLDRYYKRSGDSFLKMEHFEVADMFGRRPNPVLQLTYKVPRAGTTRPEVYSLRVVLSLSNSGRGTARAPYLAVCVEPPFAVNQFGVDGNSHEGLPRLVSRDPAVVKYGGMADTVIHPHTAREILAVGGDWNASASPLADLRLSYEIAAEGMLLSKGELVVTAEVILAGVRGE